MQDFPCGKPVGGLKDQISLSDSGNKSEDKNKRLVSSISDEVYL